MKVRILGKKSSPYSKGLFDFDEGGLTNSKSGYGTNFGNMLTTFNVGNSHLMNPHEGILVGVDSEGTPNLVEEGEVIWSDRQKKEVGGEITYNPYVFSDRLMPTAFMIKGVSATGHKRNKDLDKVVNNTIKIKRNKDQEGGKPGDTEKINKANITPTLELLLENFRAYLDDNNTEESKKEKLMQQFQEMTSRHANGGKLFEEGEEIDPLMQLFAQLEGLENEYSNEDISGEDQQESEDVQKEQENTEDVKPEDGGNNTDDEQDQKIAQQGEEIEQLKELIALLQELLQQQQELALEGTAPTQPLTLNEQEMPEDATLMSPEELAMMAQGMEQEPLMAADGGFFDQLPLKEREMCERAALILLKELQNSTYISDKTERDIDNAFVLQGMSMMSRTLMQRYIKSLREMAEAQELLQSLLQSLQLMAEGGRYGPDYKRLSSAGKALFRTIMNGRGNPNLKDAIMTQFQKLPTSDLQILLRMLLNMGLFKNGGRIYAEGDEMSPEELLAQELMMALQQEQAPLEQMPLEGLQDQLAMQLDLEILLQILQMLELVLLNPLILLDLQAMQLLGQQIQLLALQITTLEGKLMLQLMMQAFQLQLQQLLQGQLGQQQLQGSGDPNIDKLNANIPTAVQQQQMDQLQAQQEALAQLQLQIQLQLLELAQGYMAEGGNTYAENGDMQEMPLQQELLMQELPLISDLDSLILLQIQLIAQSGDPNAELQVQLLALQLSPEGQQILALMLQGGSQELQQLQSEEVITQILDQAFELLRESGLEPIRYNKTEKGGKSFADVVKEISKEYEERPNDPISKRTLNSQLQDLADALESIREMKHKELLDNAFKKMNPLELEQFKQEISDLILQALGVNQQLEAPQEQELQLVEQQQATQELMPYEAELQLMQGVDLNTIDEIIRSQGIDPSQLSPEEYQLIALQITLAMQEQQALQTQEMPLELILELPMSDGGKFAEGGEANKFDGELESEVRKNKYSIDFILRNRNIYRKKDLARAIKEIERLIGIPGLTLDTDLSQEDYDSLNRSILVNGRFNGKKEPRKYTKSNGNDLFKGLPTQKDAKPGQLYLSNGHVMIKGDNGKGYKVLDSKGNIDYKSLLKAGLDNQEIVRAALFISEGNYSNHRMQVHRDGFSDIFTTELAAGKDGNYSVGNTRKPEGIFTFDNDSKLFKFNGNAINASDNTAKTYFGDPTIINADRNEDDYINRNSEEFGKFWDSDAKKIKNAEWRDFYQKTFKEFINQEDGLKAFRNGRESSAYLNANLWDKWIDFLNAKKDNPSDGYNKNDYELLLKAEQNGNWTGSGEFDAALKYGKNKNLRPSLLLKPSKEGILYDRRETDDYVNAAIEQWKELYRKDHGRDPSKAEEEAMRISSGDRLKGLNHPPLLQAYAKSQMTTSPTNNYTIYEILDENNKGTGEYMLYDSEKPGGWIVDDKYNSTIKDDSGNNFVVKGIRRNGNYNIVNYDGVTYLLTDDLLTALKKKLGDNYSLDTTPDGKKLSFSKNPYETQTINQFTLSPKETKLKDDDKKWNPPSNIFGHLSNGLSGLAAIQALNTPLYREFSNHTYTPEVLTASTDSHLNPSKLFMPDTYNTANSMMASLANSNRAMSNLGGSAGTRAAMIAANNMLMFPKIGEYKNLVLKAILDLINSINQQNFQQLAYNDKEAADISKFNALAYNTMSNASAQQQNANDQRYQSNMYDSWKAKQTSDANAMALLANTAGNIQSNIDKRYINEYLDANGLLPQYLIGRNKQTTAQGGRIRRKRGWSDL